MYKLKLNGGDIKSVQGDSGHSQAKMVTDQYSHIIDEDRKRNAELFEKAFYGNKGAESVSEEAVEPEHPTLLQQPTAQGTETGSGLDIATLTKLANSPEMAALLKALAQNL